MNARSDDFETTEPAVTPSDTPAETVPEKPKGRGRRRLLMLSVPLLLALAAGGAWLFGGRYIGTDNAYVHQPMISVAPEVGGRVADVLVHENEVVAAGDPIFRIDPTDYRIALESAEAQLANARLAVEEQRAAYATADAQLAAAEGIESVKERELERQEQLTDRGVGTQAALDEATVAARTAVNAVSVAQRQRAAAAAALGGNPEAETDTLPSVRAAIAARDAAARQLSQTEVTAATAGTVSQIESLNPGQFVAQGSGISTLVDATDSWIEANFKETQLDLLKVGQPVTIEIDAYPGLDLEGEVESFGPATGSQFSLIPAQNATGNWVKVVQRVPVRIRIANVPERPLVDGMSVKVSVDTGENRLARLQ